MWLQEDCQGCTVPQVSWQKNQVLRFGFNYAPIEYLHCSGSCFFFTDTAECRDHTNTARMQIKPLPPLPYEPGLLADGRQEEEDLGIHPAVQHVSKLE